MDFGSLPGDRNARSCSVAAFRRRLQQLTSKYENPSLKIPLLMQLMPFDEKGTATVNNVVKNKKPPPTCRIITPIESPASSFMGEPGLQKEPQIKNAIK